MNARRAGLVLSVVTLLNFAVSVVFAVLTLAQSPSPGAGYALVRSVVLLAAAVSVVALRRPAGELIVLAWIGTAVQLADAVVGMTTGDLTKIVGPIVLGVLTGVCAVWRMRLRATAAPAD